MKLLIFILLANVSLQHHVIIDDVLIPQICELRLNQCICPFGMIGPKCEMDVQPFDQTTFELIVSIQNEFEKYDPNDHHQSAKMIKDFESLYDMMKIKGMLSSNLYERVLDIAKKAQKIKRFKPHRQLFYEMTVIAKRKLESLRNWSAADNAIQVQEMISETEVQRLIEAEQSESTSEVFDEWMFTREIQGLRGLNKLEFNEFSIIIDIDELRRNIVQDSKVDVGFISVVKVTTKYEKYGEVDFIAKYYDTLGRELVLREDNNFNIEYEFTQVDEQKCECFSWKEYRNESQYQSIQAVCEDQICTCQLKYLFNKIGLRASTNTNSEDPEDSEEYETTRKKVKLNDGNQKWVEGEEAKHKSQRAQSEEDKQQSSEDPFSQFRSDYNNSTSLSEEERKQRGQDFDERVQVDDDDDYNYKKYTNRQNPYSQKNNTKQKRIKVDRQRQTQQPVGVKPNMMEEEELKRQEDILEMRPPQVISTAPDYFSYYHSEQLIQFLQFVTLMVLAYQRLQQRDEDEKDSIFSRSFQNLFRGRRRDFDDNSGGSS